MASRRSITTFSQLLMRDSPHQLEAKPFFTTSTRYHSLSRASLWTISSQPTLSIPTSHRHVSSLGYEIKPVCPVPLDNQSVPLTTPDAPEVTGATVRASGWGVPKDDPAGFLYHHQPHVKTMYENFLSGVGYAPNHECMGTRNPATGDYEWITYTDALERSHAFASGLVALGAKPGQDTSIGIYARACAEWDQAAVACSSQAMMIVSMYDSMSTDSITHIQKQAELRYIIAEDIGKAKRLLSRRAETPSLEHIILIYPEGKDAFMSTVPSDVKVTTFAEVLAAGRASPVEPRPAEPEDIYMVCYTSGTTGEPKGALISHRAVVSVVSAFAYYTQHFTGIKHDPDAGYTILSFLPLAHMFAQIMHGCLFHFGGRVGYFSGDVNKIAEDAQALKPHTMAVVPRLLNRLHDQVQQTLAKASPVKRAIFNYAYRRKWEQLQSGSQEKTTFWDKLVFGQIQARLGGQMELMVTGSAPIAPDVLNFCRVVLSSTIIEGYGQTECCACCTGSMVLDLTAGHVGPVFPSCHVKLKDVPDMGYYTKNNEGEICVRGPSLMNGYFKDPEKTAETIDPEGWLLSGDIGRWQANGTLAVIDRKKHILKLSQGEYVAPERVETIYVKHPLVEQVFVEGDPLQAYLVAIVIPFEDQLREFAAKLKLPNARSASFAELCAEPKINAGVLEILRKFGADHDLNALEQVKAVHVTDDEFTVEKGLLTPTLKSRRPKLRKYFDDHINRMYREMKDPVG